MRLSDYIWEGDAISRYRETGWNVTAGPVMVGPDGRDLRVRYYSQHLQCSVLRSLDDCECREIPCPVDVVNLRTVARRSLESIDAHTSRGYAPPSRVRNSSDSPIKRPWWTVLFDRLFGS